MATLKIIQSANQVITVSDLDSKTYNDGDTVETGKELIASIAASEGYKAGTLNKETYTVVESDTTVEFRATEAVKCVIESNGVKYDTFQEAVNAAKPKTETTITLLEDIDTCGTQVGVENDHTQDRYITFNLNGHTVNVSKLPLVGANLKYQTNAFRFMEGCKVTFKNGTLTTDFANCKMFIQNYSDLVLEDVTVDISKGVQCAYAVSNNYGGLTCKGNTIINAPNTDGFRRVAFDCYYGLLKKYYNAAPVITFGKDFTGKVVGAVEYDKSSSAPETLPGTSTKWTEAAKITIENGTFDIELSGVTNKDTASITIDGGKFVNEVYKDTTIPQNWKTEEYIKKEEEEKAEAKAAAIAPVINYILDMNNMR